MVDKIIKLFRNNGREDVQILDICRHDESTYRDY